VPFGPLEVPGADESPVLWDAATEAAAQRDEFAALDNGTADTSKWTAHQAYGAGYDSLGNVYTGCSSPGGGCAENDVFWKWIQNGEPGKLYFVPTYGVRTGGLWQEIPVCYVCQLRYMPDQFPYSLFEPGASWSR
jgi:hypothetical protein